ncbi:MAG TPA: quinolinate synthase NadA [Polyangiaceae bacterium]|nr:quinolinate synthase NadA [Polyangiaceae bacterium]
MTAMAEDLGGLAALDLDAEIRRLKKERNAVLLAHYYQEGDIQDCADFIGDSLQLAKAARDTSADVILFAGVHFMAETAKILNPERTVLVPDMAAGCSLADGCPADRFAAWKARHPGSVVLSYINCSAEVKSLSDCIVTSSNAEKIVRAMPTDKPLLFAPDRNLGKYLIKKTGRDMILWPGTCIVHETFSERKLIALKYQHPEAKIIAHPECEESLLEKADFIGSTAALLKFVEHDSARCFIVATEPGILHQMRKNAPGKELIAAPPEGNCACNECPFMRLNTPEKIYLALRDLQPRLEMSTDLIERARIPMQRMMDLS